MLHKGHRHLHSQLHRQESCIIWCILYILPTAQRKCSLDGAPVSESSERSSENPMASHRSMCLFECVSAQTEYPISAPSSWVQPQLLTSRTLSAAPRSPVNPQLLTSLLTSSLIMTVLTCALQQRADAVVALSNSKPNPSTLITSTALGSRVLHCQVQFDKVAIFIFLAWKIKDIIDSSHAKTTT